MGGDLTAIQCPVVLNVKIKVLQLLCPQKPEEANWRPLCFKIDDYLWQEKVIKLCCKTKTKNVIYL